MWLDRQLRADLYIRPAGRSGAGQFPALSAETPKLVAAVEGVEAVDIFHGLEFRYQGQRATLGAGNIEIVRRYGRLRFLSGGPDRDEILRSLPGQDNAMPVSEPFANKHEVRVGDRIILPLGPRAVPITVAGIYYDYSTELGWVILDRSTLLKYLPDQPITNLAVYLRPGVDASQARRRVEAVCARYRVVVAENKTLRSAAVVVVFDRTFAITYALGGGGSDHRRHSSTPQIRCSPWCSIGVANLESSRSLGRGSGADSPHGFRSKQHFSACWPICFRTGVRALFCSFAIINSTSSISKALGGRFSSILQ